MDESNLKKNARLWITPSALQPPEDHPEARSWLEPWIEIEEHVESVGPDKKLVVFTAPRELRPLDVPPVVRRMSWPPARRSDLEHGPAPEISQFELGNDAFEMIEATARELTWALRQYPYTVDAVDPSRDIELPPNAWTWHSARWRTRKTFVHLRWTVPSVQVLDNAWHQLWDCIAGAISGRDELVGWRDLYDDRE